MHTFYPQDFVQTNMATVEAFLHVVMVIKEPASPQYLEAILSKEAGKSSLVQDAVLVVALSLARRQRDTMEQSILALSTSRTNWTTSWRLSGSRIGPGLPERDHLRRARGLGPP
jgi:hypothetical protein